MFLYFVRMRTIGSILEIFLDNQSTGVAYKNKALKRNIVHFLDQQGHSTITDISNHLGISVPKGTSLVNELIQDGLLGEFGKEDSTGGRKASLFGLVPDCGFFLGIDVRRYYINVGLIDFQRNLIKKQTQIPFLLENTLDSYQQMIAIISGFIAEMPFSKDLLLAAGINLSGRVNRQTGQSYSYFHFHEVPLSHTLTEDLGITVFLENDSRAMAFGEFFGSGGMQVSNALFLNMDYGVGMGILINGKMYYGKSGFSGEFGHIPLFDNEIICNCGKKGCLETEASGWAVLRNFKEKVKAGSATVILNKNMDVDSITLPDILKGAQQEDVLCIELLADFGEKAGRGVAFLINVFNPEMVVIGGALSQAEDYIRLPMRSTINKLSLSLVNNDTQLRISKLGETAGVIGGALLAREKLINGQ